MDTCVSSSVNIRQFQPFFQNSSDAIIALNNNGDCYFANEAALSLFKINPKKIKTGNIVKLLRQSPGSLLQHIIDNPSSFRLDDTWDMEWEDKKIKVTSFPIGEEILLQFKEVKNQIIRNPWSLLINNFPDMVALWDKDLKLIFANTALEKTMKLPLSFLLDKKMNEIYGDNDVSSAFMTDLSEVFKTGKRIEHFSTIKMPDGHQAYHTRMVAGFFEDKEIKSVLTISRDTTELKRADNILDALQEACCELDLTGRFKYINKKAEEIFGIQKHDLLGKIIWEAFSDAMDEGFYKAVNNAVKFKIYSHQEYASAMLGKWIALTVIPEINGVIVIFSEKNEVYDAKSKLLDEHSKLKEAQKFGHIGHFEKKLETENIYWSDELFRIHGLKPQSEKINIEKILAFTHPDDQPLLIDALKNTLNRGVPLDLTLRIIRRDGKVRYIQKKARLIYKKGKAAKLYGTVQDITKMKRSDIILDTMNEVCFELDENFNVSYANKKAFELWKYASSEIIGKNIWKLMPEKVGTPLFYAIIHALKNHEQILEEIYCPDVNKWIFLNANPQPQGLIVLHFDITKQVTAREKVLKQEAQFKNLVENTPDLITRWDKELKLVFASQAFELKTGIPNEKLYGKNNLEIGQPDEMAIPWMKKLQKVFKTEKSCVHYNSSKTAKGLTFYQTRMVPEFNKEQEVQTVLAIARDITELKRSEEKNRKLEIKQRQEIIYAQEEERRRISEELHNDVGQILFIAKLKIEKDKNGELYKLLDSASHKVRNVSSELSIGLLLDFGLDVALKDMVTKKFEEAGIDYEFKLVNLPVKMPQIMEISIFRIVQELINNIIKHAQAEKAIINIKKDNNWIKIDCQDNGIGFTNPIGSAPLQSMGLRIIKDRIKLLKGDIDIKTAKDKGTRIYITLPLKETVK